MTQSQRIISILRTKGEVHNWELTEQGIQQYNARIYDARKILGCTFHKNERTCSALEHIISDYDNHFIYKKNKPEIRNRKEIMTNQECERKLEELRRKWKEETDPTIKGIIERQGKALKRAMEEKQHNTKTLNDVPPAPKLTDEDIKQALL